MSDPYYHKVVKVSICYLVSHGDRAKIHLAQYLSSSRIWRARLTAQWLGCHRLYSSLLALWRFPLWSQRFLAKWKNEIMTSKSLLKTPISLKQSSQVLGQKWGAVRDEYRPSMQITYQFFFLTLKNKTKETTEMWQDRLMGVWKSFRGHWKARDSDTTWSDLMLLRQGQLAVLLLGHIGQNYFPFWGLVSSPGKRMKYRISMPSGVPIKCKILGF